LVIFEDIFFTQQRVCTSSDGCTWWISLSQCW